MRKFNLEEAKAGKAVCTRAGDKARIICFDRKSENYPIIALIQDTEKVESVEEFTINGYYYKHETEEDEDLMMVDDET